MHEAVSTTGAISFAILDASSEKASASGPVAVCHGLSQISRRDHLGVKRNPAHNRHADLFGQSVAATYSE